MDYIEEMSYESECGFVCAVRHLRFSDDKKQMSFLAVFSNTGDHPIHLGDPFLRIEFTGVDEDAKVAVSHRGEGGDVLFIEPNRTMSLQIEATCSRMLRTNSATGTKVGFSLIADCLLWDELSMSDMAWQRESVVFGPFEFQIIDDQSDPPLQIHEGTIPAERGLGSERR